MPSPSLPRRLVPLAVAAVLIVASGLGTARPGLSEDRAAELAGRYGFAARALNEAPPGAAGLREVSPTVEHIRSWISAVGAGVALADADGNGRSDDVCLIDPRDDSVRVSPAPGTGERYEPARLAPEDRDPTTAPMGCVPADLDADGDTDFLVYYWGRSPVQFLRTPDGYRAVELVEPRQVWNTTALGLADIDGDGHLDVLVGNYFPDSARVLDPGAADDDRMRMQNSMGKARNGGTNRLLLSRPHGADRAPDWTDASDALPPEAASAWTLAIGTQDLTGDLLPEIYQAEDFGPDHLLVNHSRPGRVRLEPARGDRDLVSPKSTVLGRDSFKGMGVAFTRGPGRDMPTIVVSNITSEWALQESNFAFTPTGDGTALAHGDVPYTDRAEELGIARSGWSWDVKAADFDGDGTDELFQATGFLDGGEWSWALLQELALGNDQLLRYPGAWPDFGPRADLSGDEDNRFWARSGSGPYNDLAGRLGLGDANSRGIAVGDVNGDGRPDAAVANQWQDSTLLVNTARWSAPATVLVLERPDAGPAIGAEVTAHPPGRDSARAQLYPANGHAGVSSAELFFATGTESESSFTVRWMTPSGPRSERVTLAPGRHTLLLRDDGSIATG